MLFNSQEAEPRCKRKRRRRGRMRRKNGWIDELTNGRCRNIKTMILFIHLLSTSYDKCKNELKGTSLRFQQDTICATGAMCSLVPETSFTYIEERRNKETGPMVMDKAKTCFTMPYRSDNIFILQCRWNLFLEPSCTLRKLHIANSVQMESQWWCFSFIFTLVKARLKEMVK